MPFELNENEPERLAAYLQSKGVLPEGVVITHLAKAGEGNMNLTLRAEFGEERLIVKQANPFVQKYPSIAAPVERASMEYTFFRKAAKWKGVGAYLPAPLFFDAENHLLVMEDLGTKGDYTKYYRAEMDFPMDVARELLHFLQALHSHNMTGSIVENSAMRQLNHTHIFDLPFRTDNGIDLDAMQPGLQALAEALIFSNAALRAVAERLGEVYLNATGPALLHGDFFPGSWLEGEGGVKVIDPEFCFTGPPEFDLGVFKAHLIFCGRSNSEIDMLLTGYGSFDHSMADQFAGIELLRRLFGVAQLPLLHTIPEKENLSRTALHLLNL